MAPHNVNYVEEAARLCSQYRDAVAEAESALKFSTTVPAQDETHKWMTLVQAVRSKADAHAALADPSRAPEVLDDLARVTRAAVLLHQQLPSPPAAPQAPLAALADDGEAAAAAAAAAAAGGGGAVTGAIAAGLLPPTAPTVTPADINAAAHVALADPSLYATDCLSLFSPEELEASAPTPKEPAEARRARLREDAARLRGGLARLDAELASPDLVLDAPLLSAADARTHTAAFAEGCAETCRALGEFSRLYRDVWEPALREEANTATANVTESKPTTIGTSCVRICRAAEAWSRIRQDSELVLRCKREWDGTGTGNLQSGQQGQSAGHQR
jgi:hypothetical protein